MYRGLPDADRARAVFLGRNYGEAAAIDVFGAPLGLPPAISGHNTYWLWGPRGHDGSVVIRMGGAREDLARAYASVELAGRFVSPLAMPYEDGQPVWLCRGRRVPLREAWPDFRHYD